MWYADDDVGVDSGFEDAVDRLCALIVGGGSSADCVACDRNEMRLVYV